MIKVTTMYDDEFLAMINNISFNFNNRNAAQSCIIYNKKLRGCNSFTQKKNFIHNLLSIFLHLTDLFLELFLLLLHYDKYYFSETVRQILKIYVGKKSFQAD